MVVSRSDLLPPTKHRRRIFLPRKLWLNESTLLVSPSPDGSSWPEAMKGRLNAGKKTSRIQNQSYTYKWLHYSILHVNCDRRWKWFGWNNYTSISLSPRLTILKISWGPEEIKLKLMSTEFQTWNCMKVLYIVCTPGDRFMWNNSLPILNKTTSCHKSQIPLLQSQTDCEFFLHFPKTKHVILQCIRTDIHH